MNVNAAGSMQQMQMRKMDGTGGTQGNGMGKAMKETLSQLPEETQTEIKSFLETLDQTTKKEMATQITQLDASSMSTEDLGNSIKDILGMNSSSVTNPYSTFSTYA